MISWGLIWAFSPFSLSFSLPSFFNSPSATHPANRGPPPSASQCVCAFSASFIFLCVRAHMHCIALRPSCTLLSGHKSLCAYMYQSGRETDGRHSSGPQMSSFSSVSCLKAQCGHMSLSYRISDADEINSALISTLFALTVSYLSH